MQKKNSIVAATAATAAENAATSIENPIQEFITANYELRRNTVSGSIEFRAREENNVSEFSPLTHEDLNSLILEAEEALPGEKRVGERVRRVIESRITPDFDPVAHYCSHLPAWDGKNHVGQFLDRLPGLSAERRYWAHLWLRGLWAQALQLGNLHGNELVLTLIGDQGCGKSTFCRIVLPPSLRQYYLDHVNLANKFDKEMALTNNLLVNIDELEQVKRPQQAELKHLITKNRVNGRPIYGRKQQDRNRYASFTATTNNRHPLNDPSGSRRFLCIEIPAGQLIDNESPIDYDQLAAQLLHELHTGERYWLSEEERCALERANTRYQTTIDIERIVAGCVRKPEADEPCRPLPMSAVIDNIRRQYPFIEPTQSIKTQIGRALAALGIEIRREAFGTLYYALPR